MSSSSSPCGGNSPSAAMLPTYAANCYGSARMPVAYQAGACVGSAPFVNPKQPNITTPPCCQDKTQIFTCLAGGTPREHVSAATMMALPKSWSL